MTSHGLPRHSYDVLLLLWSLLTFIQLKPTGFEEFYAEAPVTPAIYEEERGLYDPDITFFSRIETAIQRYCARRKFHQANAHIFDAYLQFGGIDSGQKQFGGGISKKDLEDKDAAEIAAITARHFVSEDVQNEDEAEVDFETLAKGFLYVSRIALQVHY